ncbi:MAG: tetratricopeptide repeat protein [Elusimicrobiota bacterium]
MKYFLLMFFSAAMALPVARAYSDEGHWSGKHLSVQELENNAVTLNGAIKQDPANVELYIKLGFTYAKLEKADEAQTAFENAVRLDPKKAIAHYMLGLIYEKKDLKDKAIAAWKACLETATEQWMSEKALKHLHHLRSR